MFNLRKPKRDASMSEHVGPIFDLWLWRGVGARQFTTKTRRTIITRGAYTRANSRKGPNSNQETQQEKDSTRNGC
jgi:hypothetical protein